MARAFSTYPVKIQRQVIEIARRKAAGKRVTFYDPDTGQFSETHVQAFQALKRASPEARRAIEAGMQRKAELGERAKELGFKSVEEYLQVSPGMTGKDYVPIPRPKRIDTSEQRLVSTKEGVKSEGELATLGGTTWYPLVTGRRTDIKKTIIEPTVIIPTPRPQPERDVVTVVSGGGDLPDVFKTPISPFEEAMGTTIEGELLVSTLEGVKPVSEVYPELAPTISPSQVRGGAIVDAPIEEEPSLTVTPFVTPRWTEAPLERLRYEYSGIRGRPETYFGQVKELTERGVETFGGFLTTPIAEDITTQQMETIPLGKWDIETDITMGAIPSGTAIIKQVTPYTEQEIITKFPFAAPEYLTQERARIETKELEIFARERAREIAPTVETEAEFQKEMGKVIEPEISRIEFGLESYQKRIVTQTQLGRTVQLLPPTLITAGLIGGASHLVPAVGRAVALGFGAYTATHLPEIREAAFATPGAFTLELAAWGVGGAVGRKVVSPLPQLRFSPILGRAYQKMPWVREPVTETPTGFQEQMVQPFTRPRATLMLKTEKGKYVLGKTKTGEAISIGGGIEKGQTPRQALLAELKQETGLRLKDIKGLKFKKKFVFPEETHYVYQATIKDISKIKPASDISKIITISPGKAKGITGLSPWYPTAKGGVRSYELGLISYLETGKKPTWLGVETKAGKFYLGTQSRYNIPWEIQKRISKQPDLLLTHATPKGSLWFKRGLRISGEKVVRGEPGLYVQPPTSIQQKTFFRMRGYDIKKAAGEPTRAFGGRGTIGGEGYVGLSYLDVYGKTPRESLGIKFGWRRPTIYTFKEKARSPFLKDTRKAKTGFEFEKQYKTGTVFVKEGLAESIWIGGRRIKFQQMKLAKDISTSQQIKRLKQPGISIGEKRSIIGGIRKQTGIDYGEYFGRYKYVSPVELGGRIFESVPREGYKRKEIAFKYKPLYYQRMGEPYKGEPYKALESFRYGYGYKAPKYKYGYRYKPSPPPYLPPGIVKLPKEEKKKQLAVFGAMPGLKIKPSKEFFGRPFRYQPGIASLALGIKAPKAPKLAFTGLVTRPIIRR
jgi:hypothetical protein